MVLVDNLSLLEVKISRWLHWWGLDEWLELVSWVSWSSLKTKNSLDWLFTKHWESKSGGDVWEFLVLSPLNIVLGTFIVIVMVSSWSVSKSLLELELNGQSLSSGLSPSVVVLEEHVIQMKWVGKSWSNLVHVWGDIAGLINNTWSNLSDMHVNQKTIVSIDFKQFVLS